VSGSISTSTGVAPARTIDPAVAKDEYGVVMTSSPAWMPSAISATSRASVPDETAIAFAEGFYRGVAFGHSVRTAFDLGVNAAVLRGLGGSDLPQLIADHGVAEKMIIAS